MTQVKWRRIGIRPWLKFHWESNLVALRTHGLAQARKPKGQKLPRPLSAYAESSLPIPGDWLQAPSLYLNPQFPKSLTLNSKIFAHHLYIFFKIKRCIRLKGWVTERCRGGIHFPRGHKNSSWAGPKLGSWNFLWVSPMQGQEPICLGQILLLFQGYSQGIGSEVEQVRLKPPLTWNASIPGCSISLPCHKGSLSFLYYLQYLKHSINSYCTYLEQ